MLDLFDGFDHQFLGGNDINSDVLTSDLQDFSFCVIQEWLDGFLFLVLSAAKPISGQNQSSKEEFFPNGIHLVNGSRRPPGKTLKLGQKTDTNRVFQMAPIPPRL